ncbi:MAG: hypothetical protein J4F35_19210 [Candidatus Latescibacteria bacterium]|nr:hypothetical protein [Candidatus Latescibacterota bacterium]
MPPVEHGTDVHLHPHGTGVVQIPALRVGEIPGDRVAEDVAAAERREVDMASVERGTVETGCLWVELLGVEDGIARGIFQRRTRVVAEDVAAVFVVQAAR